MSLIQPDSRILFVRPSAVGDVLCALPALEALRAAYPKAFIGYLVEDRAFDLIREHPAVDKVHHFPRKSWVRRLKSPAGWLEVPREFASFASELRQERYDVSIDLQRTLKGAALSVLSGAKLRVGLAKGYSKEGSRFFTHVKVTPGPEAIHFADYFMAVAAHLGAPPLAAAPRLPKRTESEKRVSRFLAENALKDYVVIHPGTSDFGKAKRWPPRSFSELARRVESELSLRPVIAWGPGEKELAEGIAREGKAVMALETTLLDLAELISKARLFIGCDSGPMHLSSVVGTPCVALFGPKDPAVYGPYRHPHARIVQPPGGIGPTESISVDSVVSAARALLQETKSSV